MSNIFKLNLKDILSAAVSAAIVAVLGLVVIKADIFSLNLHDLLNVAVLTAAASLLKAFTTTDKGNFVGVVPIK